MGIHFGVKQTRLICQKIVKQLLSELLAQRRNKHNTKPHKNRKQLLQIYEHLNRSAYRGRPDKNDRIL